MDKQKEMKFNINNFLLATTKILDIRDIEKNNVTKDHSLRIAFISLKIGEKLHYKPKEMFDLCAYSLFHNYINNENIRLLKIDNSLNLLSNIIDFVHQIDEDFDFSREEIENRIEIKKYLNDMKLHNEIVKIMTPMMETIDFWLDCQSTDVMQQYIYRTLYDFTEVLRFEDVFNITSMFGSLETDVTNLIKISHKMTSFYNFSEKDKWTFLIAMTMVNFGKLSTPINLLNKPSQLTTTEYEIVKSNIYNNRQALKSIYGFDDIAKWATRHQEQLNGQGYPSKLKASDLSFKDRIIAVINTYNALVSTTKYRESFSSEEAFKILKLMDKNYYLDDSIIENLEFNLS